MPESRATAHGRTPATGAPLRAARARQPALLLGGLLSALLLATAILSHFWTPYPPGRQFVDAIMAPPGKTHWLGTDIYGHDIFSQLMAGTQSSVLVGMVAVAIGLLFGVSMGLLAAARKGWIEEVTMRIADITFAFPAILTAIMLRTVYGSGVVISITAIGIASIPVFARITRASANGLWQRDFVTAARACGRSKREITREHILPNLAPILIVQATIQFAIAILAEAALSYLGLGTQYPTPSWGRMLSEAQSLVMQAPALAIFPGLAIALAVFGLNLLGDGLRDRLDPKTEGIRQ